MRTACMATSDRMQGFVAAARPAGIFQRRAIEDPHRESKDRLLQPFGGDFRRAFERLLIADDDRRDPPVRAAERFQMWLAGAVND